MSNIPARFYEVVEGFGDKPALFAKKEGVWKGLTGNELKKKTLAFASGMLELGAVRGDKAIIISENRPEWVISDISLLHIGMVDVPVFVNSSPEDLEYVINHSDSRYLIVSRKDIADRISSIGERLDKISFVITMEACTINGLNCRTMDDVISLGEQNMAKNQKELDKRLGGLRPDDTASIIYTSGTTGTPKGVMLSHRNFLSNVETCSRRFDLRGMSRSLSFLPLCHVLERTAGYYTVFFQGVAVYYAESIDTVADNLAEVGPDVAVSVPRLYEKMHARVLEAVEKGSAVKKKIFAWAVKTGGEYFGNVVDRRPQPLLLRLKMKIAVLLVFRKLKAKLGGRLKFFISGGAPLSRTIAEFFGSAGIMIYEGYGLTETSPVIAANYPGSIRPGTVGTPIETCEVKIADDGEIIMRGPGVMKGYYKNEAATSEVIDPEGWIHTGDVGELKDGFLRITDRKKDIIVTANGKNVAPQAVENALKLDAYITEAVVFGDGKPYLVGLIVPDFARLGEWAREQKIDFSGNRALVENPKVVEYLRGRVGIAQKELSGYSQIKKFRLMQGEFTIDGSEITPSLKLRRRIIGEKYADLINGMYGN